MNRRLIIYGAGAHARKVYRCAMLCGYNVAAFLVDQLQNEQSDIDGIPLVPFNTYNLSDSPFHFVIAIGNSEARMQKYKCLVDLGGIAVSLTHPNAYISETAIIGNATVVFAGAIIEEHCEIGIGTIVDIGSIVDHDCRIGEFCHLKPGCVCPSYTNILDFITIDAGAVVKAR